MVAGCCDEFDGAQMVDRQALLAGEPADAARGCEPADADAAVVATGERPASGVEHGGDIRPPCSRADAKGALLRVQDVDRA
jgi:hypothetical protein